MHATYLVIPVLAPMLGLAGVLAVPVAWSSPWWRWRWPSPVFVGPGWRTIAPDGSTRSSSWIVLGFLVTALVYDW